jgi:chromosome segregation ATPase
MDIAAIVSIIGALVTVGGLFIQWRKSKAETGVLRSEESENITDAAGKAVGVLNTALAFLQTENAEYKTIIKEFRNSDSARAKEILELQTHRDKRDQQIADLTESNEAMAAKIAASEAQIEKLNREYTREISRILMGVKAYMSELLQYFETHNLSDYPIPPEDLLDTNSKIILQKRKDKK